MSETLGGRIRRERQARKMTLRRFAAEIGVKPPFVTDIEADRRRPSPEKLERIAEVLGVPLEEFAALDPRITPAVKEWMEDQPAVSRLLRKLQDSTDPDALLKRLEEVVEAEKREDDP